MTVLGSPKTPPKDEQQVIVATTLLLIGLCYMLVLAVENWFYNLFAKHVQSIETAIRAGIQPLTSNEFAKQFGASISPFHPSFFFALVIVLAGNTALAYFAFSPLTDWMQSYYLSPLRATLLSFVGMAILFFSLFRKWNKTMYPLVIVPLQNLFTAPAEVDSTS